MFRFSTIPSASGAGHMTAKATDWRAADDPQEHELTKGLFDGLSQPNRTARP
jgi:hypothetical protein